MLQGCGGKALIWPKRGEGEVREGFLEKVVWVQSYESSKEKLSVWYWSGRELFLTGGELAIRQALF